MSIYESVKAYKDKYPSTLAFRLKKHAEVVEKNIKKDERVLYTFCGHGIAGNTSVENGASSYGTVVVALTNKRIVIGHKGLLFGSKIKSIDMKKYNDMTVDKGLIWSSLNIDTFKEEFKVAGLTAEGANEAEENVSRIIEGKVNETSRPREEVEVVKPKRQETRSREVVRSNEDERIIQIRKDMNRMAKKDALLRERLRLTNDPKEIQELRASIISNYNEYQRYKEFLNIIDSYDRDCEMRLSRK